MSKRKYCPNYAKLYPNIEISDEVMAVLKKSDRKMKYAEYDLKSEQFVVDQETATAYFIPSREDSLERLLEVDTQFKDESSTPEHAIMLQADKQELNLCLAMLNEVERALIDGLFYKGMTECEYAIKIGMSQTTVSWRKRQILAKLRKIIQIYNFYC